MEQWAAWSFESVARDMILEKAPSSFPRIRELRIQIAKLQRMIRQRPDKGDLPTGTSLQVRKRLGKDAVRVGQQVRKVRAMTDKSYKEWMQRKGFPSAAYRQWKKTFDGKLAKALRFIARNRVIVARIGRA